MNTVFLNYISLKDSQSTNSVQIPYFKFVVLVITFESSLSWGLTVLVFSFLGNTEQCQRRSNM
jgi:hypothetical protein